MVAATIFFLFALVNGQGNAAALTTLGLFKDQASCATAQAGVKAALKGAADATQVFCVSSDDLTGLSKAAHSG